MGSVRCALLAFLLVVVGCTSGATPSAGTRAFLATVTILGLTPAAGAVVGADTTLVANIEYRIPQYRPQDRYLVAILFESTDGGFFNHPAPVDWLPVERGFGTVRIEYPLRAVWNDPQLRKPVRVHVFLNQRLSPTHSVRLAAAGPFEYASK